MGVATKQQSTPTAAPRTESNTEPAADATAKTVPSSSALSVSTNTQARGAPKQVKAEAAASPKLESHSENISQSETEVKSQPLLPKRTRSVAQSKDSRKRSRSREASTQQKKKRRRKKEVAEKEPISALPPTDFWKEMQPYFAEITEENLKDLFPEKLQPDDPIFDIPKLGENYRDKWAAEDGTGKGSRKSKSSKHPAKASGTKHDDKKNLFCKDMTSRLVSALVHGNGRISSSTQKKIFAPVAEDQAESPSAGVIKDHNPNIMPTLEERIKIELRSIGLLEHEKISPSQREDDEICATIRSLQNQLRQQNHINNQYRAHLYSLAVVKMTEQDQNRQERKDFVELEKKYLSWMVTFVQLHCYFYFLPPAGQPKEEKATKLVSII